MCAVALGARAQSPRQPVLDVEVRASSGFLISDSNVATAPDGGHIVLLMQEREAQAGDKAAPQAEAKVELVAVSHDGVQRFRQTLPLRHTNDWAALSTLGSGEIVVLLGVKEPDPSGSCGTILHLAADGTLATMTSIGSPQGSRLVRECPFSASIRPVSDGTLLLYGGLGSGPYLAWLGKLDLRGRFLWSAVVGHEVPTAVEEIAERLDGGVDAWLVDIVCPEPKYAQGCETRLALVRFDRDGKKTLEQSARLAHATNVIAIARGYVAVAYDGPRSSNLLLVDENLHVTGRARWPYGSVTKVLPAGDGFSAIAHVVADEGKAEPPDHAFLVKADAKGSIVSATAIGPGREDCHGEQAVRAKGGAAVLVKPAGMPCFKNGATLRLVRFADGK